jgi:outer membrane protein assembly factor BamB
MRFLQGCSRYRRWAQTGALGLVVAFLFGCSSSDKRNDPAELQPLQQSVAVNVLWRASVGGETTYGFAPIVVGESVYAASADGHVARVDSNTGAVNWNKQVADELSAGVGSDGQTVAVVTPEGEVIALDANGQEKWRAQATSEVNVVPWVGRGVVVVRAGDYRVQAFNAENGERIWSVQRPGPALSLRSPARMSEIQNLLLTGMPGGRLLAIEPGSGAVIWEGIVAVPRGASDLERVNDVVGIPIVRGDLLCAVAYQGRVACFNAAEGGRMSWSNNVSSVVGMGANNQLLFVPDNRDRLTSYSLESGEPIWTQTALLNRRLNEPAATGDWLVVGDFEGIVHIMNASTGDLAGRVPLGGEAMRAPVIEVPGGAIVQAGDSSVVRLQLN